MSHVFNIYASAGKVCPSGVTSRLDRDRVRLAVPSPQLLRGAVGALLQPAQPGWVWGSNSPEPGKEGMGGPWLARRVSQVGPCNTHPPIGRRPITGRIQACSH